MGDSNLPSQLSQMLEGFSQSSVERLIGLLQTNWESGVKPESEEIKSYLSELYKPEDHSEEAVRFRLLMQNHEIHYLGGSGKSTQNFLIINRDTGSREVFGVKRNTLLSEKMILKLKKEGLIPATSVQKKSKEQEGLSLFVAEYFPSGSLEKRYENTSLTPLNRYKYCSEDLQKMIAAFEGLQRNQVLFSDAKTTNWIIDKHGKLLIIDYKSLLTINQIRDSKNNVTLLQSSGYSPLEIEGLISPDQELNIENIHAFILGANIFDCLTGQEPPEPITANDFKAPIFEGIIGQHYKDLVLNLTQMEPSSRMSLENAKKELKFINFLVKASSNPEINLEEIVANKAKILERFSEPTHYVSGKPGENERLHLLGNKVNFNHKSDLREQYQNLKGDFLKQKILSEFKEKIEQTSSKDELETLKTELKSTPQYKLLEKSQGLFTKDGKTSSVKAFESMFKEQAQKIDEVPLKFT